MEPDYTLEIISCRICRESANTQVTFEVNSEWSSLFEFCFGFQVCQNGPLSFCENCSNKLRDYGSFKHLCLQSEEMWKSMINMPSCYIKKLNVIKEKNNNPYEYEHDTKIKKYESDHDDNYLDDVIWVTKEEKDANVTLFKKLEDELTEITIKKIENSFSKNGTSVKKKCPKIKSKNSRNTRHCKYGAKTDMKRTNKSLKILKNTSNVTVKQEATNLYCGLCEFTSISSLDLNQHLVQHCQDNILKCLLCSFEGKDVAHMISHRYTHIKIENPHTRLKVFECPMCSEKHHNCYKLQYHYRSMHLKTKGGLCIFCEREFVDYNKWRTHEKQHVSRNYICDHCNRSFVQRCQIVEHMATHYDIFSFICDFCGKGFKKLYNLKQHTNSSHRTYHKQVTCKVCRRKYKNDEVLNKHMRDEHSQRKYLCEVCSKGFCTKIKLRMHFYFHHSDEKPYVCDLCGARYRSNMHLKIHKRKHTGDLPYTCKECGTGFTSSAACKRHQSVHTGVRPVKCLHCDKTFYFQKQMQMHCNSKHKDTV